MLLWQPIKWIICLKRDGQVIASSAAVCLAYRCLLGRGGRSSGGPGGRLQAIGPIQTAPLLHSHQQIELSGDFSEKKWLGRVGGGGCSILLMRAGDSHNSIFS